MKQAAQFDVETKIADLAGYTQLRPRGRPANSPYCRNENPDAFNKAVNVITRNKGVHSYSPDDVTLQCINALKSGSFFSSPQWEAAMKSNQALGVPGRLKMNRAGSQSLRAVLMASVVLCNLGLDGKIPYANLTRLNDICDLIVLSRTSRACKRAKDAGFLEIKYERSSYGDWRAVSIRLTTLFFLACGVSKEELEATKDRAKKRYAKREQRIADINKSKLELEERLTRQKAWRRVGQINLKERKANDKAKQARTERSEQQKAHFKETKAYNLRLLELKNTRPDLSTEDIRKLVDDEFLRST